MPVLWFYRCMFLFYNSELHAKKNRQIRDELNLHVNYDGHFRHNACNIERMCTLITMVIFDICMQS